MSGSTLDTFAIAASGLSAERLRLQTIASNMANARTTRTDAGGPYQRQSPIFRAEPLDPFGDALSAATARVAVDGIQSDTTPGERLFDPTHPDADADGFVTMPNVNVLEEMVDLMTAQRAYEANANAIEAARDMAMTAIQIGK